MLSWATNWLDAIVHAWSDWMCDMSVHVTWLVVLLWLLDRPLKRTSARLRFVLWSLVLVRLIVPPELVLPTGIGWWCGDWFAQHIPSWALEALPASNSAASIAQLNAAGTIDSNTASAAGAIGLDTGAKPLVVMRDWTSFFFTLWLGFAAAQAIWLLFGWRQIRRWLALSTPLTDARSQQALASAAHRVGIGRQLELRDSGQCSTPLVIGYMHPVLLLPTAVRESLSQAELESVLVHELTHVARRDGWWRLAQVVLGILYFFHPAVWLARYKLNQLCEEACDEQTVLALSGERRNYAQAIVKAATLVGYQPPYLAMNMVGSALPVKRRLQRILDPALTWNAGGGWQRSLVAIALALIVLPNGYRASQATPPERMRQAGLPSTESREISEPVAPETALATADAVRDSELEQAALKQLSSPDFETRLAAYQTLEQIGTLKSLPDLESAFLNRSGIEQDAAKRALDRLWSIIREQSTEATQSTRLIQNNEES